LPDFPDASEALEIFPWPTPILPVALADDRTLPSAMMTVGLQRVS
jgi:hypothetical protein